MSDRMVRAVVPVAIICRECQKPLGEITVRLRRRNRSVRTGLCQDCLNDAMCEAGVGVAFAAREAMAAVGR